MSDSAGGREYSNIGGRDYSNLARDRIVLSREEAIW